MISTMFSMANHSVLAKILLALLFISAIDFTVGQVGVCHGPVGHHPNAAATIKLCINHNIRRIRLFDPDDQLMLRELAGTGIEVILGVKNTDLEYIAASPRNAENWFYKNVQSYPDVRFRYIAVGNEVSPLTGEKKFAGHLVKAMENMYHAVQSAGRGYNQIKVSTSLQSELIGNSYLTPANGAFKPEVISFIRPIISFLVEHQVPFLANIYPYYAYTNNYQHIPINYALFTLNGKVNGYQNLFHAMLDAMYVALEKQGGRSLKIVVSETGWPSAGQPAASPVNARTYNTNLPRNLNRGNGPIEAYVYALFDEDQKKTGNEDSKHFGIFDLHGNAKYDMRF